MRKRVSTIIVALLLASCGGAFPDAAIDVAPEPRSMPVTLSDLPATESAVPATEVAPSPPPVWAGFATTSEASPVLAAYTRGALDVYESPESQQPAMTLDGTTIIGSVTVLGVLTAPESGWAEVMLPVRPNGSTGWVRADDVDFYVVDGEIIVDLTAKTLTYLVDSVEVLRTEVGIGSDHNRTPVGHYFVTDNVTLADPNSPWGPHALGISARSETILEFNGGDGIIGIHGTNNPDSIGGNISLGCVRLPNDMITALHEMVPLGTRVTVNA